MKKVLKNILRLEIKWNSKEYRFVCEDGTLIICIKDGNIILFEYLFDIIKLDCKSIYPSLLNKNGFQSDFNFKDDTTVLELDTSFVIKVKSRLMIQVEKSTASISIYKDSILVHGGKIDIDDQNQQLTVFKRKNDVSFLSIFQFKYDENDRLYLLNDDGMLVENKCKDESSTNKSSAFMNNNNNPLNFIAKVNSNKSVCGLFFDLSNYNNRIFNEDKNTYYSTESYNSRSRYYFFDADNYKDVLKSFYRVVGFTRFLPLFAYGNLKPITNSINGCGKEYSINSTFKGIENEKIPCEGCFSSSVLYDSLEIDHECNFHRAVKIEEFVELNNIFYSEIDSKGFFLKDGSNKSFVTIINNQKVSLFDFTNSDACSWYKNYIKKVFSMGYSGIWYEKNNIKIDDPDVSCYDFQQLRFQIMENVFEDVIKEINTSNTKKRVWIRCVNRFDNSSEKLECKEIMANSKLMKSIENAVLSLNFVVPNEIYDCIGKNSTNSNKILSKLQELVKAHYTFLPYIYNVAYESCTRALPVYRNQCLEFDDNNIDDEISDCLFGNSILKVFAKKEGVIKKEVYLPKDYHWYNAVNKKFYYGGTKISVDKKLGLFNYFVKEGSIIPLNKENVLNLDTSLFKKVDFKIYRIRDEKEITTNYFEDDGNSQLEECLYNTYQFVLSKSHLIVTKSKSSIKSKHRIFTICNEVGIKIASFDPDNLFEGDSISYKL